jgi:hypothetical protein
MFPDFQSVINAEKEKAVRSAGADTDGYLCLTNEDFSLSIPNPQIKITTKIN